jgi:hypothetical protein
MGAVCHKSYDKYNAVNQLFDLCPLVVCTWCRSAVWQGWRLMTGGLFSEGVLVGTYLPAGHGGLDTLPEVPSTAHPSTRLCYLTLVNLAQLHPPNKHSTF